MGEGLNAYPDTEAPRVLRTLLRTVFNKSKDGVLVLMSQDVRVRAIYLKLRRDAPLIGVVGGGPIPRDNSSGVDSVIRSIGGIEILSNLHRHGVFTFASSYPRLPPQSGNPKWRYICCQTAPLL